MTALATEATGQTAIESSPDWHAALADFVTRYVDLERAGDPNAGWHLTRAIRLAERHIPSDYPRIP
jgi:hypothetical protein